MDPHIYEAFKKRNPHTTSLQDLFMVLQNELTERIAALKLEGQRLDIELLGLAMKISPVNEMYYGNSLSTKATKYHRQHGNWPKHGEGKEPGFEGKVWFRTDRELSMAMGSTDALFRPSMMHLGGGGYSTWGGPWNQLGKDMEKLNAGLPWGRKGRLSAYAYDIHFFVSDIPGLDHAEVMLKMQDRDWEKEYYFEWQDPGQEARDKDTLAVLDMLHQNQSP